MAELATFDSASDKCKLGEEKDLYYLPNDSTSHVPSNFIRGDTRHTIILFADKHKTLVEIDGHNWANDDENTDNIAEEGTKRVTTDLESTQQGTAMAVNRILLNFQACDERKWCNREVRSLVGLLQCNVKHYVTSNKILHEGMIQKF